MSVGNLKGHGNGERPLPQVLPLTQPSSKKRWLRVPGANPSGKPRLWRRILRSPITWVIGLVAVVAFGAVLFVAVAALHPSLYDWFRPSRYTARQHTAVITLQPENETGSATGPLFVHPTNPRYFTDGSGRAIYLTGTHTWANFQDSGATDPPEVFDYTGYLDYLEARNHNFFRLWEWEQAKWGPWLSDEIYFGPMLYLRTGPGTALDGKPKFDVTQFNQAYFDRMRERVIQAGDRGMYVSIMLFDGWAIEDKGLGGGNPWLAHPFNASNNINGINGDPNNDNQGHEVHSMQIPAVTALQEAYIRKVINTVNDLDNVLYEISNESHGGSWDWQYHMINFIKDYQNTLPQQHPVGMTVPWPGGDNSVLFNSPADWISPNNYFDPPVSDGSKVIISDTDHIWGIGGDREWVWKSFVRGHNPIFMDPYNCSPVWPPNPCNPNDPVWVSLRLNMGYARAYADRMNLAAMMPRGDLCATQYCLANPVASGAEYLVYLPVGSTVAGLLERAGINRKPSLYLPPDSATTVDLTNTPGELFIEWLNPENGDVIDGGVVTGGAVRTFSAPFSGDAVLYLYQSTQDTTPPQISQVSAFPLDTTTTISWLTNEPATRQVAYGLSPTLVMSTTEQTNLSTSHLVHLSALSPETTYYYRVYSTDSAGNRAESKNLTFTTLAEADIHRVYLPYIGRNPQVATSALSSCPKH
ncbi:MAG: fibronectin type III domain-containing protein [Ardenticatenaceae bacterium]|nr:fibronectin type III domain-containing protein [Ardenticatenaceae bacterium]